MIQDRKSARIYACALLASVKTAQELELLNDFLKAFAAMRPIFSNVFLKNFKFAQFNDEIIEPISQKLPQLIRQKIINFLKIIFLNRKLQLLPSIQKVLAYETFKNKKITLLSLITAKNWDESEKISAQRHLEKIFPAVSIDWQLDVSLLSGLKICFEDWVIDLSGRKMLMLLKKQFETLQ